MLGRTLWKHYTCFVDCLAVPDGFLFTRLTYKSAMKLVVDGWLGRGSCRTSLKHIMVIIVVWNENLKSFNSQQNCSSVHDNYAVAWFAVCNFAEILYSVLGNRLNKNILRSWGISRREQTVNGRLKALLQKERIRGRSCSTSRRNDMEVEG